MIKYYDDFLSPSLKSYLLNKAKSFKGVEGLTQIGKSGGLENKESLNFLCKIYQEIKKDLNQVLEQRILDRKFIDERTKASSQFNKKLNYDFLSDDYQTVLGHKDGKGRVVIGPLREDYYQAHGKEIAPLPTFLKDAHVTLFGPPGNEKMCINAMNSYHRKLAQEPEIVKELLATHTSLPKWGADDEDSKTPLREDLIVAGENLTKCFEGELSFEDRQLEKEKLALPIKRFPGLALPCTFLFYEEEPLPLHLYDFVLHLYANWMRAEALVFYVPKLENEEEARYIKKMIEVSERKIKELNPEYTLGSVRLMIVLENPRAVFRTNEIIDELYPYFAGASLGWHDYLASTARVFKEDGNYRIPVKADPNIVIKYIKASHELLANVVGRRGGVKVGGMYGILPMEADLKSDSFQITLKGYIKDVITQMKRDLTGFWVAHPDFVRLGLALVEAWRFYMKGDKNKLHSLVKALLVEKYQKEVLAFIEAKDIASLDFKNPLYARSLLVADIKESDYISNNHPDEIRYNVFQSLQYLADWLSGNGCVALPAQIENIPIRVMDDLATAERSRWEVWHELYHKRFSIDDFLRICYEEYHFIRKNLSHEKKQVQVKFNEQNEKWYPVALKLMIKLMSDKTPVEFATELLLPFTISSIREVSDPWNEIVKIDNQKFRLEPYIERFHYYFEFCGSRKFASQMATNSILDLDSVKKSIMNFSFEDILEAASFHGDIGENKKILDKMAASEQAHVLNQDEKTKDELREWGEKYKTKFKMKFLISAKDKKADELLSALKNRYENSLEVEIQNAKEALWQITQKRIFSHPLDNKKEQIEKICHKYEVRSLSLALTQESRHQSLILGRESIFQVASLSKTIATAFAIEYFRAKAISLETSVNELLSQTSSAFRIKHPQWGDKVQLTHLMSHNALNLHYVNGVPQEQKMPDISEFLMGNEKYGYRPIEVIHEPGTKFSYSGAGFLVLEHLIEALENKKITELTKDFLQELGMKDFTFDHEKNPALKFPAFAAGALSTSYDINIFLNHLYHAFNNLNGSGPISHDTAVKMLHGSDKGCQEFMKSDMGLGVFIARAGDNKIALHQGANDGYRALYLYCFDGPNKDQGFTILAKGDLNAVFCISEIAQELLKFFHFSGIDFSKSSNKFSDKNLPQEQVVNLGYKELIFKAFAPTRPNEIVKKGALNPLSKINMAVGAEVVNVSNERFARVENMLSPYFPIFDPELFEKQGKTMDSWESVRHNPLPFDEAHIKLKKPGHLSYVSFCTKYHLGNQAPAVKLLGLSKKENIWKEIVPETKIDGHAIKYVEVKDKKTIYSEIKLQMIPDGGFSRLGLFADLKDIPESKKYQDEIAKPIKPLSIAYIPDAKTIDQNFKRLKKNELFDVASSAYGGQIESVTNEHYGPATQVISPYPPIHMFDGFESARSRTPGHFEEIIIKLGRKSKIESIVADFTYFVNNNPMALEIYGFDNEWISITGKKNVKAFAGNKREFKINDNSAFSKIKIIVYPDGGINRIHVYTRNK